MKFDFTITVAVIVLFSSIVSPIIVAVFNNHHAYKMKILELNSQHQKESVLHRRQIFEDYLAGAGKCLYDPTAIDMQLYSQSYPLALLYAPSEIRSMMVEAHAFISSKDYRSAAPLIEKVSFSLNKSGTIAA